jgi:hypothetical protein
MSKTLSAAVLVLVLNLGAVLSLDNGLVLVQIVFNLSFCCL